MQAAMESILVCGGGSAVPGLGPRLLREVRGRVPASIAPQLLQPPDYMPSQTLRYATWMGGAVLSKVSCPHLPPTYVAPHMQPCIMHNPKSPLE